MSYCSHWAFVVRPSLHVAFYILIFSETIGPIWTKLGSDGPWVVPFQNCVRWPRRPTKMAAVAKNRQFWTKSFKKSSQKQMRQFKANIAWMVLGWWTFKCVCWPWPPSKMATITRRIFNIGPYRKIFFFFNFVHIKGVLHFFHTLCQTNLHVWCSFCWIYAEIYIQKTLKIYIYVTHIYVTMNITPILWQWTNLNDNWWCWYFI